MYKLYAFLDLEQFNMETWLQYLPKERQQKVLRYRNQIDRKLSVASYLLLACGLYQQFGVVDPVIAYGLKGKPYLPDRPDVHFNISHCSGGCVCAVSDQPVGVDIQDIRPFSQRVANYCCSAGELALLQQSQNPSEDFARMWAMKESYVKMTGEGIAKKLPDVDTTGAYSVIHTEKINNCYVAVSEASFFINNNKKRGDI